MIELNVKRISPDWWSRPRLENIKTGRIYVDVSCGDERYQPVKYNIPGDWHTITEEEEPLGRLKPDINFILVEG
jgi:hypothetical protein